MAAALICALMSHLIRKKPEHYNLALIPKELSDLDRFVGGQQKQHGQSHEYLIADRQANCCRHVIKHRRQHRHEVIEHLLHS